MEFRWQPSEWLCRATQPSERLQLDSDRPQRLGAPTSASIHNKNTWTLGPFVDPGHRRDIDPDPMWQLKANDGTEFVIKSTSSILPNWYMEVGALQDPNQVDYLSLMLKASNAQTTNATGIKWTVLYEQQTTPVALDQYTFTNVADPTVTAIGFVGSSLAFSSTD